MRFNASNSLATFCLIVESEKPNAVPVVVTSPTKYPALLPGPTKLPAVAQIPKLFVPPKPLARTP